MDDIQNCVQDAVYGDALEGGTPKPKSRLQTPPSKFDVESYKKENKLEKPEDIIGCPLGGYLLNKYLSAKGDKAAGLLVKMDELLSTHITREKSLALVKEDLGNKLTDMKALKSELEAMDKYAFKDCEKLMTEAYKKMVSGAAKTYFDEFQVSPEYTKLFHTHWALTRPLSLDSIVQYRDLGRGAFGAVAGCAVSFTGKMFAIKIMNRKQIKGKKALKLTIAEKTVLAALGDNPSSFCIYLRHSFFDRDHLYFILPLLSGGDLSFHLKESDDRKFSKARAQLYTLEVAKGLMHLHEMGFVYRDMKPENVLLNDEGHACISDLGLCAKLRNTKKYGLILKGRAGTPGYWPPEMLSGGVKENGDKIPKDPYDKTCDYWSLACMLYEMLSGYCPFTPVNTKRFKPENVKNLAGDVMKFESGKKTSRDEVTKNWDILFCDSFDEVTQDFIKAILKHTRLERLGQDPEAFKQHPYFKTWYEEKGWKHSGKDIIWDGVFPESFDAPWQPSKTEINAVAQDDIEGRNNENDYDNIVIDQSDDPEGFYYSSILLYQRDILAVLDMEEAGELNHLSPNSGGGGCCSVQ